MTMDDPVVSVVIPAYRCEQTICDAVESALKQNVPLEVIVVANDPDDALMRVMRRYEDTKCVRFVRNDTNLGASGSRNHGVQIARGKYVAFLDADDYWAEGKLEKQITAIEKSGDVLCCTARMLMDAQGNVTGRIFPVKETITYRQLLKHNSIACSSVLMKTEVAREFPMHSEHSHEDYIMWMEILQKYTRATGVNEPLLYYRVSNTGKSGNKLQSARMTFSAYRQMGFGLVKSCACFCSYALNGVKKYYLSGKGNQDET